MNHTSFYRIGGLVLTVNGTNHVLGITDDFGNVVPFSTVAAQFEASFVNSTTPV